ncbi:MAG TPA: hypothetical protein VHZ74_09355 [Bryobacteraceae bacterium]|nr:hypothetical protein [Bryobacteraceae bacterium]
MNRGRVLYPAFQVGWLVGKLARDIAVTYDALEAGADLAVGPDNARNGMATSTTKAN